MRSRTPQVAAIGAAFALSVGLGCIFPDTEIDFVSANPNTHAVHFYESTSMLRSDRCECRTDLLIKAGVTGDALCEGPEDDKYGDLCPLTPLPILPRFMDPEANGAYDFCGCPEGEKDTRSLLRIDDLYVQDLDRDVDGNPDQLFAALLLDMPNDAVADPMPRVAYRQLLDPRQPLLSIAQETNALVPNVELLERPDPQLRRIFIANPSTGLVDLCNDAGTGSGRLSEGWHTITLMVTDRPWFSTTVEVDGEEATEVIKDGVPDVANSATWATRQYTFHCSNAENNPSCECEPQD